MLVRETLTPNGSNGEGAIPQGPPPCELKPLTCTAAEWADLVFSVSHDMDTLPAEKRRPLNEEQALAFDIFAQRLRAHATRPSEPGGKPLRMYVRGGAGLGKSRLISAMQELATKGGMPKAIWTGAYTGLASSLVDGSTIVKGFGLRKLRSDNTRELISNRFRDVLFIIIDEISLIGGSTLDHISRQLAWALNRVHEAFGGMSRIFL